MHLSEDPNSEGRDVEGASAGRCRPGLRVPNLDDFHKRMILGNARCSQEPKDVFGARLAQYVDPDGLTISVGEYRRGD